ncbi:hypothetical protein F511_43201 [Dorcoceras hygrometricum]|uniref:Uncharacterized protein n=1 Tax=Dorcoceras hygrometricum TaxID=472368 RepID=A0A2Z7ALG7_9LAMI|nr:hypothetical protein F511_43201 [Dorcoceras hygrometricum]
MFLVDWAVKMRIRPSELETSICDVKLIGGRSFPVVELIDESTAAYREVPVSSRNWSEPGTSCQQGVIRIRHGSPTKINSLDGHVAAIRNEQLEFQTKLAVDILSLSNRLGDLVGYIRGGDAKKGEGSSRRRPLPPPVNQGEGSGNRTSGDIVIKTEIAQRDIDNKQRDILERLMAADRQRERERGSRSSSGSHKRRKY